MSTNYPTSIDSPVSPVPASAMNSPSHAAEHQFSNDAIVAIETLLGIAGAFNFAKLTDSSLEQLIRQQTFNQFRPPNGMVSFNSQRITNVGAPLQTTDAAQAEGSLIGSTYYEPAFQLYGTTSATGSAVDSTNLSVTFTTISNTVLVELSSPVGFSSGNGLIGWTLYDHGTTNQRGYWVGPIGNNALTLVGLGHAFIRVTGLSAGTQYQWDWGWASSSGGSALMAAGCNQSATVSTADVGPIVMRVFGI